MVPVVPSKIGNKRQRIGDSDGGDAVVTTAAAAAVDDGVCLHPSLAAVADLASDVAKLAARVAAQEDASLALLASLNSSFSSDASYVGDDMTGLCEYRALDSAERSARSCLLMVAGPMLASLL